MSLRRIKSIAVLILCAVAVSWSGTAFAGLVGVNNGTDTIYGIDTTTGAVSNSQSTGLNSAQDLAYDPSTNTYYVTDQISNSLFTVNAQTGATSFVGNVVGITGLAFDTSTNTLYGTSTAAGFLVSIDPNTAAATSVGQYADAQISRFVTGLAYDPITDTLYGLGNNAGGASDLLITLDRGTGAGSSVGFLGTLGAVGLGIDLNTSELFTVDNNTNLLHGIDSSTGAITSSVASSQTHGLASASIVPEPGMFVIFMMAAAGIGFIRYRY